MPGKLNVFTDRPSRVGEGMYNEAVASPQLINWVSQRSRTKVQKRHIVEGLSHPTVSQAKLVVAIPKPHTRLQEVAAAVQLAKGLPKTTICLVMPKAAYADHRWDEWNRQSQFMGSIPPLLPLYTKPVTRSCVSWASSVSLSHMASCAMGLWKING